MGWNYYVETFYDPPPEGWQGGAYTPSKGKKPNHDQLARWGKGAIPWSKQRCRDAVEKSGQQWDNTKWRTYKPAAVDDKDVPQGTPLYKPTSNIKDSIKEVRDEGEEECGEIESD